MTLYLAGDFVEARNNSGHANFTAIVLDVFIIKNRGEYLQLEIKGYGKSLGCEAEKVWLISRKQLRRMP